MTDEKYTETLQLPKEKSDLIIVFATNICSSLSQKQRQDLKEEDEKHSISLIKRRIRSNIGFINIQQTFAETLHNHLKHLIQSYG